MSLNENNNDKLEDTTVSIDDDPTAKASRGNAAPIKNWLLNTLYGDISVDEFKKFGLLGLIFLFIIGSYWLLRPLKDAVFFTVVGGKQYQPYAKMLSVVVVVMVVMIYSKLVDIFSREKLFYVVMGFFACAYWILALLLNHPTIGLQNEEPSPYRLVGWITYFTVECYGSITVSMFWSFVASCTQSSSARRGYSLIVGGAQIGSIMGPLLAANAQTLGVVPLFFLAGACAIGVGLFVRLFVTVLPMNVNQSENDNQLTYDTKDGANTAQTSSKTTLQKRSGFFDGLILIGKHPYITGIALVSTLNEVVATITDYQMKVLAHDTSADTAELASFLGTFGMAVNSLALVAALVGTSYALRRFGVRVCLLAYPIAVAGACSILFFFANSEPLTLLRVFFFVMVLTKGLSYALNNPSKEILYIPTSKDVKYKAKGWIDLFGMRSAKAIGSTATTFLKELSTSAAMVQTGVFVSLGVVGVWLMAANRVGKLHAHLSATNEIIQ